MGEKNLVVIVADGIRNPVFKDYVSSSKNFKELFSEVSDLIAPIPETCSSLQSFVTGKPPIDPGPVYRNAKTGKIINGFSLLNVQRGYIPPGYDTIFDDHPEDSVAILIPHNKGATHKHLGTASITKYLKHIKDWNRGWNITSSFAVDRFKLSIDKVNPRFTVVYFPGYDRLGHTLDDSRLSEVYHSQLDKDIGEMFKVIDKDTTVVFMSDHSMVRTEHHIDLNKELSMFKPKSLLSKRYPDSVALVYGNCIGKLHLEEAPLLAEKIAEKDFVENVFLKVGNGVKIYGGLSEGVVLEKDGKYKIEGSSGKLGEWHTPEESLEFTMDRPNMHIGAHHMLLHKDAGNVALIASENCDFGATKNPEQMGLFSRCYKYNHGRFGEDSKGKIAVSNGYSVDDMLMQNVRGYLKELVEDK